VLEHGLENSGIGVRDFHLVGKILPHVRVEHVAEVVGSGGENRFMSFDFLAVDDESDVGILRGLEQL